MKGAKTTDKVSECQTLFKRDFELHCGYEAVKSTASFIEKFALMEIILPVKIITMVFFG